MELRDNATGTVLYKTSLKYDKQNNLELFAEKVGDANHRSEYTYDRDNRETQVQYDGSAHKVSYTYDALGRVSTRVAECGNDNGKLTSTYTYVDGGYGTNSTTSLVKKITQNGISFEYEYDTRGNITSEKRGSLTTTYQYDAIGQLIRVNDPHENATWVYNYDRGGNITSKVKYAYTTGTPGAAQQTIPYAYGDSNWKDKLTSYNGQSITYDAIGNPTNDGTWTYTWQAGRQLKQMTKIGTTVEFKYDHNGLRIGKVVNGNETKYIFHGKLISHMAVDNDKLHFFYDAQSQPAKVNFNGTVYTYVHNLQNDIVGILDNAGNLVVEYKYNVWGRPISTTGSLADTLGKLNPYRFRGYVWDDETGLYHLRSRLYNPETGRFINEDGVIVNSILGKNIFCYGWNNSTIHVDSAGTIALSALAVKAVIGACTAAAESIASDLAVGNRISVFGVIKDAALGAVTSLIPSRIVSGLVSFAVNTVDYLWECKTEEKTVDGTVIIWEGVGTFAGELLGAGFEHGKKTANKTVDKIVQGVYETGINVAISGMGKQMKKENEEKARINSDPTGSFWNMPYLICVWNPDIGKYEERVVDPLA